jgi:uncharacterized protein YfdQ (DUF2303 family)
MEKTEADTVAALAVKAAGKPSALMTESGREYLVLPNGFTSTEVTPPNSLDVLMPKRIKQHVTLQNAEALVEYLNRFKGDDSVMFADVAESRIVAALDYHGADKAALVEHRATLALPCSEEWKAWTAISGKLLEQLEFARFIEENAPDVKAPVAGELIEAVRDLQARRSVNFIKAVRTDSENESFEYTDNTEARTKGGLELPTKFLLSIPVYFGDPDTEIFAFLRWKLDDSKLLLGIKLHRAEHVRQAAFKLIVTDAMERTGLTAVYGKIG